MPEPLVIRLESSLWETTALLIVDGPSAVAIDPGISPDEIEALRERAAAEGAEVTAVLATHADWDHVCGIGAFPRATAAMASDAAAAIEDGTAEQSLASEGHSHGFAWSAGPRCDRVLHPGTTARVGPLAVETIALGGHSRGDVAYRIRSCGVLAVGDYLSTIELPFVYQSTAAYRATLALLLDLLRRDPPRTIFPGHGRSIEPHEAIAIGERHLDYLHRLRDTVLGALERGDGLDEARRAAMALEPDGEGLDDELRAGNADCQIAELIPS